MNQKSLIFLSLVALLIIVSTFFIPVFKTKAFFGSPFGGLNTPFGGMVTTFIPCTCGEEIMIGVGGSNFLVTLSTQLFANFTFTPGHNVLGLASQIEQPCMVITGNSCSNVGNGKPITMMGTS